MSTEKKKSKTKSKSPTTAQNVELKKSSRDLNANTTGHHGDYVILRNQGIYSIYRKVISLSIFSAAMAIASLMTASYFYGKEVPPRYVPLAADGKLIPQIPLDQPNLSVGAINEFALQAVRKINRYDYYNWKEQLTEVQGYFRPDGWNEYLQGFQAANTINAVLAAKMVVSSEPTGDVKLLGSKAIDIPGEPRTYVWRVEVPIKIMYMTTTSGAETKSQTGVITLTIVRVPTTVNPRGIGIRIYNFDTSRKK